MVSNYSIISQDTTQTQGCLLARELTCRH